MFCELDDNDYLTGNYSNVTTEYYTKYIELETLPSEDFIENRSYHKVSEESVEFDEERYNVIVEESKRLKERLEAESKIAELKEKLTSSDYKIIKTYEESLVGIEAQYDIVELHEERQAIRFEINRLEKVLI